MHAPEEAKISHLDNPFDGLAALAGFSSRKDSCLDTVPAILVLRAGPLARARQRRALACLHQRRGKLAAPIVRNRDGEIARGGDYSPASIHHQRQKRPARRASGAPWLQSTSAGGFYPLSSIGALWGILADCAQETSRKTVGTIVGSTCMSGLVAPCWF